MKTDIRQETIDRFSNLTKYDLSGFLVNVSQFFRVHNQNIISFYRGNVNEPNKVSFNLMNSLVDESVKILELFQAKKELFRTVSDWELLENVEDIKIQLNTSQNLSKYLRSTRSKSSYNTSLDYKYITKPKETLESISRNILSSQDADNTWNDIAFHNDLMEDQYGSEGNRSINLPVPFIQGIFVESIIDNPQGEKLYGIDIKKKISFVGGDISTLTYKDTARQSLEITINTQKGTVPEYSFLGVDPNLVVGGNRNTFRFPTINRQLTQLFTTDDSFTQFIVKKISFNQDTVNLDYSVGTLYNQVFTESQEL